MYRNVTYTSNVWTQKNFCHNQLKTKLPSCSPLKNRTFGICVVSQLSTSACEPWPVFIPTWFFFSTNNMKVMALGIETRYGTIRYLWTSRSTFQSNRFVFIARSLLKNQLFKIEKNRERQAIVRMHWSIIGIRHKFQKFFFLMGYTMTV
jgi:hypothetical protein